MEGLGDGILDRYVSARDFFEASRSAALEAARARRQLDRMEAAEGVRAQSYEPRSSGSRSDVNGTSRVDARIDYEARMRSRLEDDYAMLDAAPQVIYGPGHDGRGGIDLLLGTSVSDCLFWRFCDGRMLAGVADATGWSPAECRRKVAYALDACDAFGRPSVIEGMGMAEG